MWDNTVLQTLQQDFGPSCPGTIHLYQWSGNSVWPRSLFPSKPCILCLKPKVYPGEYCTCYRLISGGWVDLLGALGYFSSPSVIPACFSLNSICSSCCLQLLSAATCLCWWQVYLPLLTLFVYLSRSNNTSLEISALSSVWYCNGSNC